MGLKVRAGEDADDVRAAITPIWHYFGSAPTDEVVADFVALMTPQRVRIAFEGATPVGGCGSFPFRLTTPGGHVRAAGVSMVGVMPTHRRRGALRALMRDTIVDRPSRDEPVAYLWASEERIYGRYGFGLTGLSGDIHLSREHAGFASEMCDGVSVRSVPLDVAREQFGPIFAKVADVTPGAFARTSDWWARKTLPDPAWRRRGGGAIQGVAIDLDGVPSAYALYRMNFTVERGAQTGSMEVIEAVGVSPRATGAVWRFLLNMDWVAGIKASFLPLDHPLILSVAEPRRLNFRQRDGAWLRIIDLEAALAARSFASGQEIVIEVADELCRHNAGRWRVDAAGASRTERSPDLRCDIAALASAYLGGFSWRQLVASSRAFATDHDAVVRADCVFTTRGAPWCPEIF